MNPCDISERNTSPYSRLLDLEFGQNIEFFMHALVNPPLNITEPFLSMREPPIWSCITRMHAVVTEAINAAMHTSASRFKIENYGFKVEYADMRPESSHMGHVYITVRRTA